MRRHASTPCAALETELRARDTELVYAFSVRQSVERTQPDGSVPKTNVFHHAGSVIAPAP
jgi:hypothetical protein